MAKYKATSNVVFTGDELDQSFIEGEIYDLPVKSADDLNKRGALSHPEASPFLVRVDNKEEETEEVEA
jgi:hypothetical protein|nr:MAG TPA: hypothetical protein [Caudoviricetes sp.]